MLLPSGPNPFQSNYDPSRNEPLDATVTFQSEQIDGLSFQPQSLTLYRRSRGSCQLSGGRFALGGSEYIVTLNAVKSNPTGAHLVLTFVGGT